MGNLLMRQVNAFRFDDTPLSPCNVSILNCFVENPMARMRQKADLPTKICVTCQRPFTWRKKWARDWAQVKYCSDRCRQAGPPPAETSR
jgi:hypothetical protein